MQRWRSSFAAGGIGWFVWSRDRSRVSCAESYSSELFLNKFRVGYVLRNIDALPTRRSVPGRSNCVILKFLYKICVYASVLKILIKLLSYALSLLLLASSSTHVVLSFYSSYSVDQREMVPMIHPQRTVVSRSSRDQRDTRPHMTHVTLTRDFFLLFRTLIRREFALTYNRRFNFI